MALKKSSSSGIYSAEFRRKSLRGNRLSLSLRTRSKAEASRRHAQLKQLLDAGRVDILERLRSGELSVPDVDKALALSGRGLSALEARHEGVTLSRAIAGLRADLRLQGARPKTLESYETSFRQILARFSEEAVLADLSARDLQSWFSSLSLAPRTQSQRYTFYGRLWDCALAIEAEEARIADVLPRLTKNPWREFRPAKLEEEHAHAELILSPEEAMRLLDANRGTKECALLALAYLAGLRLQEATHLRLDEDLDLDAATLRVWPRTKPHPWRPKTKRSKREIPLAPRLVEILRAHIEGGFSGSVYLFAPTSNRRGILHRNNAHSWWRRAYRRAGLTPGRGESGLVYHTGRHSFVSWALSAGEPPTRVAAYIGDTIQVLLATYAHLLPDDKERVRDSIQRIIQ